MFFGEFEYKIDEKGRTSVPPKFRGPLREGVVLAPGLEKCIAAYPISEWKRLAETMASASMSPAKLRRLSRAMFGTAFSQEIDRQGRIALPVSLRGYAGIGDEVVVAGVNNYFELWDKQQWEAEKALSQQQAAHLIESMERHREA